MSIPVKAVRRLGSTFLTRTVWVVAAPHRGDMMSFHQGSLLLTVDYALYEEIHESGAGGIAPSVTIYLRPEADPQPGDLDEWIEQGWVASES